MGSIPPLSLGPPVVRPLRMTVVRPFGKRTATVLPQAGAVASSRTSSTADNFFTRSSPYVRGRGLKEPARMIARTGAFDASQRRRACATLGAKVKEGGDYFGTRD